MLNKKESNHKRLPYVYQVPKDVDKCIQIL